MYSTFLNISFFVNKNYGNSFYIFIIIHSDVFTGIVTSIYYNIFLQVRDFCKIDTQLLYGNL